METKALTIAGVLLQLVLVWRLIHWKAWRHYPFFLVFFLWAFLRVLVLGIQEFTLLFGGLLYSYVFWWSAAFTVALRFLVVWEVFRNALPRRTPPYRVAGTLLIVALTVLALLFNPASSKQEPITWIIANLSFSIAFCIVSLLSLIAYYQLNPGRNLWGMALGIGMLSALDVLNFSAFQLDPTVFPITSYVRPASFFVQMFIWLPTLWSYSPASGPAGGAPSGTPSPANEASRAIKRALGL